MFIYLYFDFVLITAPTIVAAIVATVMTLCPAFSVFWNVQFVWIISPHLFNNVVKVI